MHTPRQKVIHNPILAAYHRLSHSTVVVHLPGLQEVWVRIPLVELIFPSFFPSYLSSSPSDLHTPPFFQSTRREIGSETTDNLSEDNPVKNAYRASAHALILTHPYIFVMLKKMSVLVSTCSTYFSLWGKAPSKM